MSMMHTSSPQLLSKRLSALLAHGHTIWQSEPSYQKREGISSARRMGNLGTGSMLDEWTIITLLLLGKMEQLLLFFFQEAQRRTTISQRMAMSASFAFFPRLVSTSPEWSNQNFCFFLVSWICYYRVRGLFLTTEMDCHPDLWANIKFLPLSCFLYGCFCYSDANGTGAV